MQKIGGSTPPGPIIVTFSNFRDARRGALNLMGPPGIEPGPEPLPQLFGCFAFFQKGAVRVLSWPLDYGPFAFKIAAEVYKRWWRGV